MARSPQPATAALQQGDGPASASASVSAPVPQPFTAANGDPLCIGDYIYLYPADSQLEPYIARIESRSRDDQGKALLQVRWFYRPADVSHPLPPDLGKDEVFHTDYFDTQPADHVLGHCKVISRREHAKLRLKPSGPLDVYVCGYTYSAESKDGFFTLKEEHHGASDSQTMQTGLFDSCDEELLQAGTIFEIAHGSLPAQAPPSLKLVRVVMVAETTSMNVTVKYPSAASLDMYFGVNGSDTPVVGNQARTPTELTVMGTKPEMDEQFTFSIEQAKDVLVRQLSCTESLHQGHLRTFWVAELSGGGQASKAEFSGSLKSCLSFEYESTVTTSSPSRNAQGHNSATREFLSSRAHINPENRHGIPLLHGQEGASTQHPHGLQTQRQKLLPCSHTDGKLLQLAQFLDFPMDGKSASPLGKGAAAQQPTYFEQLRESRNPTHLGPAKRRGQENVDPQRNLDMIDRLNDHRPSRVTSGMDGSTLLSGIDLIARHAAADAERLKREELDEGITWGSRRKVKFRGNPSCGTVVPVDPDHEKLEAASRKRKSSKTGKAKSQPNPGSNGPSSSMATDVSMVTKEPGTKPAKVASILKLPKEMQGRWSSERYKSAQLKLIEIMHQRGAIPGKPILRPALREEARKHIGDTGLLDHLLKHMTDTIVNSGERFRRTYNGDGAMEYWLEDASLMEVRKAAGIDDPSWMPPPGWKPGDRVPARGEYIYTQGMSATEAAEMKRLQEMVSKMRSEMKSLSVQVKDLTKKVTAKTSAHELSEQSKVLVESGQTEIKQDMKEKFEKMELEMTLIRREFENRILSHQSASLRKSNVDADQHEVDQLEEQNVDLSQSQTGGLHKQDRRDQEHIAKFGSQVQSISEEWKMRFDQMEAAKIDMEAQLSLMCKVVNRIQEDMQFIMKAMGFQQQNQKYGQVKDTCPQVQAGNALHISTSCDQATNVAKYCSGSGSTSSGNEGAGTTRASCDKSGRSVPDPHVGPARVDSDNIQKGQVELQLPKPLSGFAWPNTSAPMAMTGSFSMQDFLLPLLPAAVGSSMAPGSESIQMLLRLPPKKYISSLFQHQVNLQEAFSNGNNSHLESHQPSIYEGLGDSQLSPSQARSTLRADYQHQHQQENSEHHVSILGDSEPLVDGPRQQFPVTGSDVGTVELYLTPGRMVSTSNEPKQRDCNDVEIHPGILGRRLARNLQMDLQVVSNAEPGRSPGIIHNVDMADDPYNSRQGKTSSGKRGSSLPSLDVLPAAKRRKGAETSSGSGSLRKSILQDKELSTQLSLSVTATCSSPAKSSNLVTLPSSSADLSSPKSTMTMCGRRLQVPVLHSAGAGTQIVAGKSRDSASSPLHGVKLSKTFGAQFEASWLGLAPPPPQAS